MRLGAGLGACALLSLSLLVGAPAPAAAQAAGAPTPGSELMTPHRTSADTGRMAWGHQDFAHYTSADLCERAVTTVTAEVWRTHVRDTLPQTPAGDTLPTAARAVARACRAHLTTPEAEPARLWSALRLALAVPDTAAAADAVRRLLARARTPEDQANLLVQAIQTELTARPPQLAAARALRQQLEALAPAARGARVAALVPFLTYWQRVDNADSLRAVAAAARALVRAMTPAERDAIAAPWPALYKPLFWLAHDVGDVPAAQALLDSGIAEVGTWHSGQGAYWFTRARQLLAAERALYGQATRPLQGRYWFHDGGVAHPRPGVVSLAVRVDHTCGRDCVPLYPVLKQLKARYGERLDLTLITATHGYAVGTGPLAPAEEAQAAAHYFLDFWHLAAALLVDERPQTKRPDGHVEYGPTPIEALFDGWRLGNAVLVDRMGRLQWGGTLQTGADQRRVEAAIERALTPPGPGAAGLRPGGGG